MGWLDNQVALITGGASGIGLAVARRFAEEGARVALMDRSEEKVREAAHELGSDAVAITGNVTSLSDNQRAVHDTLEAFGRLDTFVGNAGIWDYMTPLADIPLNSLEKICDEILGVNVKGYVLGARASVDALKESKGSMIFTASSSSFYTGGGGAVYVASKHAVLGLVRQLAYELAPDIRVNGVAPGGTLTNLSGSLAAGQADSHLTDMPGIDEIIQGMTPVGFAAQAEDHVGHYLLLASKAKSGYTTGTVVSSDGGIGLGKKPEG